MGIFEIKKTNFYRHLKDIFLLCLWYTEVIVYGLVPSGGQCQWVDVTVSISFCLFSLLFHFSFFFLLVYNVTINASCF